MKRLLSLLTAAALMLTLVPSGALATGDTPEQEDTPICVCTDKCTEGSVNSDCAVCTADPGACQGKEAAPAPQNQETPKQDDAPETPVCTCSDKCAQDAVNAECLVCTVDPSACQGKEAAPVPQNQEEPKQNQSESEAPEAPVCTCTHKCAEGNGNPECPVCAADSSVCAGTETVEEPETPQVITVTDWSWVDTLPALSPDGKLYLAQAVTSKNLDGIIASLPQSIAADGKTIPVTWTYSENSLTFTAALPEGYVLAEGAALLTVAVVVKDATPLPVTDTGLTIGGQAISSGDYWTTDSNGTLSKYDGSGQPQDHYIHFDGSTLTLHNATITGGIEYSGSSLTIDLAGTNKVSDDDNAISLLAAGTASLTIQGAGSLAVASTNQGYGIQIFSGDGTGASLIVDTCTLTVDGNPGIYFSSNGGSVSASLTVNGSALVRSDGGIEANGTTAMDTISGTGIVFSGNKGTVYGNATLSGSLTLEKGETLTIPSSASLTVPRDVTLTNKGTITGSGTIDLPGNLMMEPAGPEDISAPEKIAYTDGNLTQAILDAVSISAEKKVTLAGQQVTVHLISDGWTKALKEGTASDVGTYTVQFTKDGNTIEKSITVAQSGSALENNVSTDKTQYTYGETITITAKPTATGVAAFSLTPPADNQMAVYTQDGSTQLSQAVNPDSKGVYTMTLDSTKLGAGTHTLMVKFTGNDNLAAASQEITVIINKADPTVSIPTGLTAVIGSTLKDVTLPSGWAWKAPDTDVGNVGEHGFPAVFTPADTANYNTREVSLTVSVTEPDLSSAKITLGTALTYNGKEQTQTVTVTLDGTTLTEGVDYTISGNTGKDAGNYTLTVTGKGNYTGKTSKAWSIAKAPLTITGVDVQSKTYDGTTAATVTGVSFKGLVNGEALAMGTDYTAAADFDDASADTFKSVTGKVNLLSSTLGKNYVLSNASFLTSGDISAAASKLSFKVDRTKPVKGQYITFSVTPQIKGDNRSFLQRVLGINAPKVEFWVNGTTKLGEVKVEEGKTSTFAYDTDKGGLKLGKNTITAEFTGDGNLKGCTESVVVYLHDSTTSAPTGDTSNIQTWTVVLAVSAVVLIGLGVGAVIYRKKKK